MGQLREGQRAQATMALERALQLGRHYLSKGDAAWLERVLTGDVREPDWKKLNKKATFKMKYKARSGKIQQILADMLQTFKDNLKDATEKEEETKSQYDKLMGSKTSERDSVEQALTDMEKETTARGMALEEAEQ